MPDDFFNQQQNQRKPRYAAGSDIDSIYTGREVPEGGFRRRSGGSLVRNIVIFSVIVIVGITAISIFSLYMDEKRQPIQSSNFEPQVDTQGVVHEPVTGEVSKDLVSFFYSQDNSKATVEAYITNGTNKTVDNIIVTFTIKDTAENVLAEKVVSVPAELASGETGDYTTVIETPSRPAGETKVWMHATYNIRMS